MLWVYSGTVNMRAVGLAAAYTARDGEECHLGVVRILGVETRQQLEILGAANATL